MGLQLSFLLFAALRRVFKGAERNLLIATIVNVVLTVSDCRAVFYLGGGRRGMTRE